MSAGVPRVAPGNPSYSQPGALAEAVPEQGQAGILGAGWVKPATSIRPEEQLLQRRKNPLIQTHQAGCKASRQRRGFIWSGGFANHSLASDTIAAKGAACLRFLLAAFFG